MFWITQSEIENDQILAVSFVLVDFTEVKNSFKHVIFPLPQNVCFHIPVLILDWLAGLLPMT